MTNIRILVVYTDTIASWYERPRSDQRRILSLYETSWNAASSHRPTRHDSILLFWPYASLFWVVRNTVLFYWPVTQLYFSCRAACESVPLVWLRTGLFILSDYTLVCLSCLNTHWSISLVSQRTRLFFMPRNVPPVRLRSVPFLLFGWPLFYFSCLPTLLFYLSYLTTYRSICLVWLRTVSFLWSDYVLFYSRCPATHRFVPLVRLRTALLSCLTVRWSISLVWLRTVPFLLFEHVRGSSVFLSGYVPLVRLRTNLLLLSDHVRARSPCLTVHERISPVCPRSGVFYLATEYAPLVPPGLIEFHVFRRHRW